MNKLLTVALAACLLPAAALADDTRTAFTLDAIKDLRERARYPEWTRPVPAGASDPLRDARLPTRASQGGPNGAAPMLTVWASTISAEAGQAVDFYARLEALAPDTHRLADIVKAGQQTIVANLTGKIEGEHSGLLGELSYADDGRGPDLAANDGVYSARFVLPAARAPAPGSAESLMVTVHALSQAGDERRAAGGVLFSNPGAHLTGNYRDFIRNGNLVIAAEAQVAAAGRYHLSGVLADARGVPLASAQTAQALQPGTRWIELSWYGLVLADRGAAGALTLSSIALTAANGMPNALGPVVKDAHVTAPVNVALLTKLPFNDRNLLETARRMEAGLKLK